MWERSRLPSVLDLSWPVTRAVNSHRRSCFWLLVFFHFHAGFRGFREHRTTGGPNRKTLTRSISRARRQVPNWGSWTVRGSRLIAPGYTASPAPKLSRLFVSTYLEQSASFCMSCSEAFHIAAQYSARYVRVGLDACLLRDDAAAGALYIRPRRATRWRQQRDARLALSTVSAELSCS